MPGFARILGVVGVAIVVAALAAGAANDAVARPDGKPVVLAFGGDVHFEGALESQLATDANHALKMLPEFVRVDLLFTDVVMPGMSGRQLATRASEIKPNLRVLYTTGYTRNAVIHNGVLDHGVAFIAKPFTLVDLATKIRQVLDTTEVPVSS